MTALQSTLTIVIASLRHRLTQTRRDEGGYSTETVIITALLVALAIAAVGIIAAKVLTRANNIPTD